MSETPKYIPAEAETDDGNANLLTAQQANVSGQGTSKNTLKTDFDAVAGYLSAVIGGPTSNMVTINGSNTFGKQYFYNTGAKCTIDSDENLNYCDSHAKVGDSVYEYIYINTLSNGLMPGIMHDIVDMAKIPLKVGDVMIGNISTHKCRCVPVNVTTGGVTRCSAAYVNTRNINDKNIANNRCSNPAIDSLFPGGGGVLKEVKDGFETMSGPIHSGINRLFILAIGILFIILLSRVINPKTI